MGNACFRCERDLPPGETFCAGCKAEVSPDFDHRPSVWGTGLFYLTVAQPVALVLAQGLWMLETRLSLGVGPLLAVPAVLWLGSVIAFPYVLYRDLCEIRGREDTAWRPSSLEVGALLALCLPVFTQPFVGANHLWKRARTLGPLS